jgi:hypothetical protein
MPDWAEFLRQRLAFPEMKGHKDERMIRELADHLEDLYQDAVSNGADHEEAGPAGPLDRGPRGIPTP